ncbi:polyprenyl synthetase family protein [Streptomyces sp. NPDC002701]|uniref:polyprenyl synthetase family protein n=1 Tax=Streptomyces sp. NPDC002701 TaxID=3364661 RepID=UPI0036BD9061
MATRLEEHLACLYAPTPQHPEAWIPAGVVAGLGADVCDRIGLRLHQALAEPVRHLVDAGGRRWRPGLVAEAIEVLGGDSERYGPMCAALELAHTGSLMVDDVQDDSPLRRGLPTAHGVFGVATALNAGTNAYFAMDRAIRMTLADDPLLGGALRDAFLAALRSAHAGQALDITGHHTEMEHAVATGDARQVLELVRLSHRLKSGAMPAAGFEFAALLTGAGEDLRQALVAFGEAVGTAYQITDDVADLTGVTHHGNSTKQVGEDVRNGKVTMPLAHAVTRLPADRLRDLWDVVRTPTASEQERADVRSALLDCGAATVCAQEADALLHRAWDRLEAVLPRSPRVQRLRDMAWRTVHGRTVA